MLIELLTIHRLAKRVLLLTIPLELLGIAAVILPAFPRHNTLIELSVVGWVVHCLKGILMP